MRERALTRAICWAGNAAAMINNIASIIPDKGISIKSDKAFAVLMDLESALRSEAKWL